MKTDEIMQALRRLAHGFPNHPEVERLAQALALVMAKAGIPDILGHSHQVPPGDQSHTHPVHDISALLVAKGPTHSHAAAIMSTEAGGHDGCGPVSAKPARKKAK